MTKTWITGLIGAAFVFVSSCGPLQQGNRGLALFNSVAGAVSESDDSQSAGGVAMTREVIEAQEVDLLRVSIISREATALLVNGGVNGDKTTWLSPDGISVTFKSGLLMATRGLGDDLMGADLSGAIQSLNDGGNHLRTLDFLDSLDQIVRRTFQCRTVATGPEMLTIFEVDYQTTIYEETCTDGDFSFKNTYWRDRAGVIWQSRQWISAQTGYLGYQRL